MYAYDANGNVKSVTNGTSVVEYIYDSSSRLRAVHLADGTWIRYVLDAAGRRVGRKVQLPGSSTSTQTQAWLYVDGVRPIAELDASGTVVAQFVYGLDRHVPDYMTKAGRTYRLVTDHVGSVRLVVDASSGAIAQRLDYDEFGRVLADSNPGFQPFGFAGGLYDPATRLVHFGAREYDAETGRWMSRDPIGFAGGDGNLYAYVGNDPVNRIDPLGTSWYDDLGNGFIGFGDHLTFGASRWLRRKIGLDDVVDPCSTAYAIGDGLGYVADAALLLTGGLALFRAARGLSSVGAAARVLPNSGPVARSLGAASRAEMIAKRVGLNIHSKTSLQLLNRLDMKVTDFIGKFRAGSIRAKFPSEFMDRTVEQALLEGGSIVRKLLTDGRFVK